MKSNFRIALKNSLIILLIIFTCGFISTDNNTITLEEYKIYDAVIAHYLLRDIDSNKNIIIINTTKFNGDESPRPGRFYNLIHSDSINTAVFREHVHLNYNYYPIENKFEKGKSCILIDDFPFKNDTTISIEDGIERYWKDFYIKYPNSIGKIMFSRPAFDKDGKIAFVYMSNHCGPLCGEGVIFALRKNNSQWEIILREHLWVS